MNKCALGERVTVVPDVQARQSHPELGQVSQAWHLRRDKRVPAADTLHLNGGICSAIRVLIHVSCNLEAWTAAAYQRLVGGDDSRLLTALAVERTERRVCGQGEDGHAKPWDGRGAHLRLSRLCRARLLCKWQSLLLFSALDGWLEDEEAVYAGRVKDVLGPVPLESLNRSSSSLSSLCFGFFVSCLRAIFGGFGGADFVEEGSTTVSGTLRLD